MFCVNVFYILKFLDYNALSNLNSKHLYKDFLGNKDLSDMRSAEN